MCTGPLSSVVLVLCPLASAEKWCLHCLLFALQIPCFLTVNHTVFVHYGDSIAIAKFLSREVSDKQNLPFPGLDELVERARKAIALPSLRNQAKICLSSDICCMNLGGITSPCRWGCLESYRHCRSHEESRFSCACRNAAGTGTELCTFWDGSPSLSISASDLVLRWWTKCCGDGKSHNRMTTDGTICPRCQDLLSVCESAICSKLIEKVSAGQFLFLWFSLRCWW